MKEAAISSVGFHLRRIDFPFVAVEDVDLDVVLVAQDELLALRIRVRREGDGVRFRHSQRHGFYHVSLLVFHEKLSKKEIGLNAFQNYAPFLVV